MKLTHLAGAFLLTSALWTWGPTWVFLILVVPLLLCLWRGPAQTRSVAMALLLTGSWCGLRQIPGRHDLVRLLDLRPQSVDLEVRVVGDARLIHSPGQELRHRFPVQVQALYPGPSPRRARGRLLLEADPAHPPLPVGSVWRVSGTLRPVDGPHVGLFRSAWRLHPDPDSLARLPEPLQHRVTRAVFSLRDRLSARIREAASGREEEARILQALLLGQRNQLAPSDLDRFARTGLVHVFAISGLHLGMLGWMGWVVARTVGIPYRYRAWAVLPVLIGFAGLNGFRASALRACIMLGCLWLAPFFYRRVSFRSAFALAVCLILALSPGQIADVGFQYSFLLVAGLLGVTGAASGRLVEAIAPDPWAPPHPLRDGLHRHVWPRLIGAGVVSCLCVGLSAPLTAFRFHLFSPIGVLGNLLAVPLVFLLLLTGFPALLLVPLSLPIATGALQIPLALATALLAWTRMLADVPFAWQWVAAPSLWLVLPGYLLLAAWGLRPRLWRPCLAGILVLLGTDLSLRAHALTRTELWVLPAGRGQSFFLRSGVQPGILVDVGSAWSGRQVVRALEEGGVDRLAGVVLTHLDSRHVGGGVQVAGSYAPGQIFGPRGETAALEKASGLARPVPLAAGDRFTLGGWTLEVLHPAAEGSGGRADDRSLVLRVTRGFRSVLVLGGAGATVEDRLRDHPRATSRLVCAGHPRDGARMTDPFLDGVQPEAVVFAGSAFGGPPPERRAAEQRVAARGLRVIRVEEGQTRRIQF